MRPILSTLLCACLVSPSAAQVHSAAATFRGPGAGVPISLIGGLSAPVSPAWNTGLAITPSALTTAAPVAPLAPATVTAIVKVKKTKASTRQGAPDRVHAKAVSAAALRAKEESFWSGSKEKPAGDDPVVADAAPKRTHSLVRRAAPLLAVPVVTAGLVLTPVDVLPAWTSVLGPVAQGAGVLAGVYALTRAANWAIDKYVPRFGGDKQDVVAAHYAANVVLWAGGAGLALTLLGVPATVLYATFGAGGLALFSTIKDVVGNLFNAGRFLIARPFTIGDRVTIGKVTGVVKDLNLRRIILSDEAGGVTSLTYSKAAAEAVTLYGRYDVDEHKLGTRLSALPQGVARALRETKLASLGKPLLYAALAGSALLAMPLLPAYLLGTSFSWLVPALPYLKAGVIALLTSALSGPLRALVERAGFDPSMTAALKALTSAVIWIIGGSLALNVIGLTWAALVASASVSGMIIGVALIDYVNAIVHGALLLREKPFKIGDQVRIGDHAGVVVDITPQHVILKIADAQYKMIPHSVVKDSLINTPEPDQRRK